MKKMTKALSLFLAVLMLALPLAGCNSTTSSAPDAAGSSESASLPESSAQEGASEQETEKADINIIGPERAHCAGYAPDHGEQRSGRGQQ